MQLVVFCVALLASLAAGAPPLFLSRSPRDLCEDMTPIHGDNKPSEDPAPYTVSVSTTAVNAGDIVTVHFSGNTSFKGVYVQARQGDTPVGQFIVPDSPEYIVSDCAPGTSNAVEYVVNPGIYDLDMEWVAPDINDVITFKATFVKVFAEFWVGIESESVTVGTVRKSSAVAA